MNELFDEYHYVYQRKSFLTTKGKLPYHLLKIYSFTKLPYHLLLSFCTMLGYATIQLQHDYSDKLNQCTYTEHRALPYFIDDKAWFVTVV